MARRIARERGVDLAQLRGTGPDGRIVAEDVERAEASPAPAAAAAAPAGEVEIVPLTSIRKTIARRLTEAWTVPVFQLTIDVEMTRAVALREQLVARMGDGAKPTLSDVLTKISASALMRNRAVNAHFGEEGIKRFPTANVGIAVAAPQGLVVPVIQRAESLSIQEIANARAELVGRARDNKLRQGDLDGGTFTISNLGMFGVQQFIAVLNPPQAAILAVGSVEERPVARDGEVVVAPDDDGDAHVRPPDGRRRRRRAVPRRREGVPRRAGSRACDRLVLGARPRRRRGSSTASGWASPS